MGSIDNRDTSWLAGIIDGEGSIGVYRSFPVIQISNTDLDIINRIKDIILQIVSTTGHIMEENYKRHPNWKTTYQLCIGNTKATHFLLTTLLPHLTGRKRKIATFVLAYTSSRLLKGVKDGKKPRIDQREKFLLQTAKELQHKGRGE